MKRRACALSLVAVLAAAAADPPDGGIDRSRGLSPNANLDNHARMTRARGEVHHPSDGGGRAWLEGVENVQGGSRVPAGGFARFRIVYEAGPRGIAEAGSLTFETSPFFGWAVPQNRYPHQPGYTVVSSPVAGLSPTAAWRGRTLEIRFPERGLAAGERVEIVYGAGSARSRVDPLREREERLWLWVDGDGDGVSKLIDEQATVDVEAGPPALLFVVVPGTARPGEEVVVRVSVLDRRGSTDTRFAGSVRLQADAGLELPDRVRFEPGHGGRRSVTARATAAGVFRVTATALAPDLPGSWSAVSNPLVVRAQGPRLYWADLHGHSQLSDGTGTPEDYFVYAREVAGLDAVALTDHDHWGLRFLDETPAMWQRIREATARFHDPGRFVTVLGYEWTSWLHGHRHVLYFADEGDVLSAVDPAYQTPAQLWNALRGRPAMTFAHHSAGKPVATNWAYPPDPLLEPVTEVASNHGNSESPDAPHPMLDAVPGNFVRDVLDGGARLGFIGSGDSHDGHPGATHLRSPRAGGLAAIHAESLTREGIRKALAARRVYATNGPRIFLETSLDGAFLGSEVPARPGGRSKLVARVIAEAPLEAVELVRPGAVERVALDGALEARIERDVAGLAAGDYLYLRVLQRDGGAAWSSPFFGSAPARSR